MHAPWPLQPQCQPRFSMTQTISTSLTALSLAEISITVISQCLPVWVTPMSLISSLQLTRKEILWTQFVKTTLQSKHLKHFLYTDTKFKHGYSSKEILRPYDNAARMLPMRVDMWISQGKNMERIFRSGSLLKTDESKDKNYGKS